MVLRCARASRARGAPLIRNNNTSRCSLGNPFRPAVILFGYPYQLILFSFFEKKFCWFVSTMPNEFVRTIRVQIQGSWRRLIWNLLATLLAGVPCVIWYIYDFRSFLCPHSFRADHNKQKLVEAEYDDNNINNNSNILL